MKNIKIVIPTDGRNGLDENVAGHFGRSETYTFLNGRGKLLEIIDNTSEHMSGQGLPPELMKAHGANVLLCKDLGPKALNLCKKLGIEIYTGQAKKVKGLFEMWKSKKIHKAGAGDTCKYHNK